MAEYNKIAVDGVVAGLQATGSYGLPLDIADNIGIAERVELAKRGVLVKHNDKQRPCSARYRDDVWVGLQKKS